MRSPSTGITPTGSSQVFEPSEPVVRHRGGGRDENGQLKTVTDTTLLAIAVAPRGGSEDIQRERDGENIACTVYFPIGTDVVNSDELTVRGERFHIIVNDWHIPGPDVGGLEVLCTRGQG
jgi:hypothetical protein